MPKHYLRFGLHAEQKYFEQHKDMYDSVLFSANIISLYASATASLVLGKLSDKTFVIDPNTHVFGHNPRFLAADNGGIRKSFKGLAEQYGVPITTGLNASRRVMPGDLATQRQRGAFVRNVLSFERNGLQNGIAPEDAKYLGEAAQTRLLPEFLVAPYFYMKANEVNDWLPVNVALIEDSLKEADDMPLYGQIVIDREILNDSRLISDLARAFSGIKGLAGCLLWVSDLSEHSAELSVLRGLRTLVEEFAKANINVSNLYGGYFSILLSKFGMTGVCHGVGYGEDRDVVPVGGGIPASKFYLTPIHQRLLYRNVQLMVSGGAWPSQREFFAEVCSGQTCTTVLSGGLEYFNMFGREVTKINKRGSEYSYATPESRNLTTLHYLEAKHHEFQLIDRLNLNQVFAQLEAASRKYGDFMPYSSLRHLGYWRQALE